METDMKNLLNKLSTLQNMLSSLKMQNSTTISLIFWLDSIEKPVCQWNNSDIIKYKKG